jgi:hypothetical protein
MRNVAVTVGATAWLLASPSQARALNVADLVAAAGRDRISIEEREGAKLAAADPDPAAARAREATIVAAWRKWYAEAVRSVARFIGGTVSPELVERIEVLASGFVPPGRPGGATLPALLNISALSTADQQPRTPAPAVGPPFRVCGEDDKQSSMLPERWDVVVLAADSRSYAPCGTVHDDTHREARELDLLLRAARSKQTEIRRLAAQGLGRMQMVRAVAAPIDEIARLPSAWQTSQSLAADADRRHCARSRAVATAVIGSRRGRSPAGDDRGRRCTGCDRSRCVNA